VIQPALDAGFGLEIQTDQTAVTETHCTSPWAGRIPDR
jgi:hypothetical protein